MSTPMWDLPEHLRIGVNLRGQGPVLEWEPDFAGWECWCGRNGCSAYLAGERRGR